MPLRIYLARNMEGHIKCPVEANPPFTLIVWTKNERPIDLTHSSRLKVNKDGTLVIRDVDALDEGRYTCTPYSPLGAGRSSSVVAITVRGKCYFCVFHAGFSSGHCSVRCFMLPTGPVEFKVGLRGQRSTWPTV